MTDDYQGAYIMALHFVVPKGELWSRMFEKLLLKLDNEGMQTGFFATEHLLPLLADDGREQLAFDLLLQEECPGWMYQIRQGATTIWERWDALRPDGTVNESMVSNDNMVSFNHYAFGSVGEFYYRYILGIKPAEPGFSKVRIQPHVDQRLGDVRGSYVSQHGKISVSWTLQNGEPEFSVETPVPAQIILPGVTAQTVPAGRYRCVRDTNNTIHLRRVNDAVTE